MNAILENVVGPIARRVGTLAGGALIAYGADDALVGPFVDSLTALMLVGVDLLAARYYRRSLVRKTAQALGFGGFGLRKAD